MHATRVHYKGWDNCYRLANSSIEMILTADVGPRIIRFGFVGGDNEFKEFEDEVGASGGDEWRSYGGHRLWHAPEAVPRTYVPDNVPVAVIERNGGLYVVQPVEALTGIQKEMQIYLDEYTAHARVVHRLRNLGQWPVELAVWCLTVMETGGVAIMPLPPRGTHDDNLLPTSRLVLWAYTDLSDPRLVLGRQYVLLRQDSQAQAPQKIGASLPDGWVAYARRGHLFVKRFQYYPAGAYPDMGCSFESYTDHAFLELETLSPLDLLNPGEETEYTEEWFLFDGVPAPQDEAGVIAHVLPVIQPTE